MVLEAIADPRSYSGKPLSVAILGFVFVTIAVYGARYLLANSTSLLAVTLVALPSVTLVSSIFANAEEEAESDRVLGTVTRYLPVLVTLSAYFVGVSAAFTFYFLVLPQADSQILFADQSTELSFISSSVSGHAIATSFRGNFASAFYFLFFNNLRVLAIMLAGSILYGAGTVLVLDWNASVIGVFIGSVAKQLALAEPSKFAIWGGIGVGVLGILPHGSLELLSYLSAALAGGILSAALLRKNWGNTDFIVVLFDVAKLSLWSIVFLSIGALLEASALSGVT